MPNLSDTVWEKKAEIKYSVLVKFFLYNMETKEAAKSYKKAKIFAMENAKSAIFNRKKKY